MLLNSDTLLDVLQFVDYGSLTALRLSCRRFRSIANSNEKTLARQTSFRVYFGHENGSLYAWTYEERENEHRKAFDEHKHMLPLGSRWNKINHLFSGWKYDSDDEDYEGPPQNEYDNLLDKVRAIVGHSAIVEAAFHYQWVEDFVSGKALQRLPSLKNAKRLKLADCRRELLIRSNVCARLETVLEQFERLKHLELMTSLRCLDWKSLSLETYLRLNHLELSPFYDDRFVVDLRDKEDDFVTFCTNFSCLDEGEKKFVRLRGHECKPRFVLNLVEELKSVQRKLTVILPRSAEISVLNEPLELSVLTNANGVNVRRLKATTSSLTILQAAAVTIVTNDADYVDQNCAGFEEKKH